MILISLFSLFQKLWKWKEEKSRITEKKVTDFCSWKEARKIWLTSIAALIGLELCHKLSCRGSLLPMHWRKRGRGLRMMMMALPSLPEISPKGLSSFCEKYGMSKLFFHGYLQRIIHLQSPLIIAKLSNSDTYPTFNVKPIFEIKKWP